MFISRRLKTKAKKVRMSQKSPLTNSVKVQRLIKDTTQGVIAVYSTQNSLVSEKAIISVYTDLRRSTKGLGIVWIKPLQIKTTTTKGGKRMGKGKGIQITYNRSIPIRAGQLVFEIGHVTQLSGRLVSLRNLLKPCFNKLSFKVRVVKTKSQPILLRPEVALNFSQYK